MIRLFASLVLLALIAGSPSYAGMRHHDGGVRIDIPRLHDRDRDRDRDRFRRHERREEHGNRRECRVPDPFRPHARWLSRRCAE